MDKNLMRAYTLCASLVLAAAFTLATITTSTTAPSVAVAAGLFFGSVACWSCYAIHVWDDRREQRRGRW